MATKHSSFYIKASKVFVFFLSFYFAFPIIINAQSSKKASIWYFGDRAGLDFSGGSPVPLTNSALQSFEGSAVAVSSSGELLFYTNGGSMPYTGAIWNRNHQMMPNGNLTGAGGCNSSFQSSLILPLPASNSKYYVFTTDCMENNAVGGLRYNIVDMNLDGGLGDVILKGIKLTGPVDESLTAIQHMNGRDWWVITHKLNTDSFYVFSLTPAGITAVIKIKTGLSTPDYAGAIVASPDGKLLVHCGLSFTTLYKFDNASGIISNPVYLGTAGYSAAFSPDCKLLYVADGAGKNIYQYDLTADDISASKVTVGTTGMAGVGYMQQGPDGKIYVAKFVNSTYLGVIQQPNIKGVACSYVDNGIYLGGRFTRGGLPNFPNNYVGECASYSVDNSRVQSLNPAVKNVFLNGTLAITSDPGKPSSLVVVSKNKGEEERKPAAIDNNTAYPGNIESNTEYEFKIVACNNAEFVSLPEHDIDRLLNFTENSTSIKNTTNPEYQRKALKVTMSLPVADQIDFHISPNPADQYTNIQFNAGEATVDVIISISDIGGDEFFNQVHTSLTGNVSIVVDLAAIPSGYYFLRISVIGLPQSKIVTKKLMVVH